jgi:hypothetical protein
VAGSMVPALGQQNAQADRGAHQKGDNGWVQVLFV